MSTVFPHPQSCLSLVSIKIILVSVISFNQPKLCPNASWNPNATTFANSGIVGTNPFALFINTNNTIFTARRDNGRILIWRNASVNSTTTILTSLSSPWGLFVTCDEQIFADNGQTNNRVDRWTSNGTTLASSMSICLQCLALFVDGMDNLYCSQFSGHRVVRRSLLSSSAELTIVAGMGCLGSTPNMFNGPEGIFVTANLDLYVADYNNHRVQLFRRGETAATAEAINGSNGIITFGGPTSVVLDADGYLFIVECGKNRILGSGSGGFWCVVGCSGVDGSASNQLSCPQMMAFDRYGNLFATDWSNNRIQQFFLSNNSCGQ